MKCKNEKCEFFKNCCYISPCTQECERQIKQLEAENADLKLNVCDVETCLVKDEAYRLKALTVKLEAEKMAMSETIEKLKNWENCAHFTNDSCLESDKCICENWKIKGDSL